MCIITATIAGALVGLGLMRNLATLRYRHSEEVNFPKPAPVWWLVPLLAAAWGTLTWRHTDDAWPILVLWLPLTAALGWLSAVDLDVQRLPDKILLSSAGWTILILAADAIYSGNPRPALTAAGIGLTVGLGAWTLHLASCGAIGFGDIKLVTLLAANLAIINPVLVLLALLGACLIAIAVYMLTRQRELPFGPWLTLAFTLAVLFE